MEKELYLDIPFIKFVLEEKRMSVAYLANAMGYTLRTVKRYLSGVNQKPLSVLTASRFARALEISIAQVFTEHRNFANKY